MADQHEQPRRPAEQVYQPPVVVDAGSFRLATRGGIVFDYEVRIGKKGA